MTGTLKQQTDRIWNAFWTGGISNPLTVIEQFTYLLFLRQLDRRQQTEEQKAQLLGTPLERPVFTEQERDLRWHVFRERDPEAMFALFTRADSNPAKLTVFDHMKQVGATGGVFAEYMRGATFMIPTPRLLDQVVQMIDQMQMDDRDTKGDLYEYLLSKIASAGTNGQFRTPRHLIRTMVEMVDPQPTDTVCDPSAGTAGFLVATGEHFQNDPAKPLHDPTFRAHFQRGMFHGIEFDPTMLRIGAMNLQLHGIETPTLLGVDALSKDNDLRERYSLILANPPFKGSLDYDAVHPDLLDVVKTKKTELLFLALMLRLLKTGGRCAVIVPDGVLFGSSRVHKAVRRTLLEDHHLQAVVSLPGGVFKPYAGVSTAILFFVKTNAGGTERVWFYDLQADGYSLDDKRQEIAANDLPDLIERYKNRDAEDRARTEQSFWVPLAEIQANDYDLSINRYKEIVYEPVEYDPPEVIIGRIRDLDAERGALLEGLLKSLEG